MTEIDRRVSGSFLTPTQIAKVAYEANAEYCRSIGDPVAPWEVTEESTTKGVFALISDPSLTPEQLHQSWMAQKIREGYRYGKVKDAEAKTHPNLVDYSALPEQQRVKDYLFQAIVRVLAALPKGYVHV